MQQVRPGPSASHLPVRVVTFNKVSIVFSSLFLLNLASMPLKAYLTEPFPWQPRSKPSIGVIPGANETFATFEERALAFYTTRYTSGAHWNRSDYFYDAAEDVDVLCGPLQRTTDAFFTYAKLPGAVLYSNRARLWLREASVGKRNTSDTALVQLGTRFGFPSFMAAIWIDAQDTVFFAAHLSRGSALWFYVKFVIRFGMTLRILYLLWTTYYVHYRSLVVQLQHYGTCGENERLEIIVGDPTCLILQNTWICLLFAVDFWCSSDVVDRSVLQLSQSLDSWTVVFATLYLSRTVWFGYLVLNLSGYVLRRCGLEFHCAQADPTSVAIGVTLVVGPLTYYQLRQSLFIDMYHALFTLLLPSSDSFNAIEGALPASVYSLLLGALPLTYSFTFPALERVLRRSRRRVWVQSTLARVGSSTRRLSRAFSRSSLTLRAIDGGAFARLSYNDWKHRLLLSLVFGGCWRRKKERLPKIFKGGSIYKLFTIHRNLQRNAAFSFRGSDCYVLSHTSNGVISHRLSLSDAMYLKHRTDVVLGLCPGAAFGRLVQEANGTIGVHFGEGRSRWLL
ncbi:hypothetical protein SPRG_08076 [Saprolegnia parasitica CBS 223.65]|uniref:Uncharacterized protein n=1 Tax=Saprolegnia parasitica (strain CBS 223.65) TaxID=695850 RepID=A0A067CJT0_SAPPC|nr:hypothetical protein SPRG_08076 [Saprolegnia parasitica CBS 223.65]KDO26786.1 hypothetical protein SPRG_08076 [Saprolegnia parasitica CBS 223.65]|eukprot:XP_012202434.1 hypothetical protein SPRG_08076 [Saprolegnia parasitica CBS 223.65]